MISICVNLRRMTQRAIYLCSCLGIAAAVALSAQNKRGTAPALPFTVVEASIPEMRQAMERGRVTSREIVLQSLARIAFYEDQLNAVITVNPKALAEADERDAERAQGKASGPLHGIPIALKDNVHTTDMPTTGGALAFDGLVPPYEATLTESPRRGRDHHREDRPHGARQLGGGRSDADAGQLQLAHRLRPQPVRSAPRSARGDLRRPAGARHGRLQLGHRNRCQLLGGERRDGNVGSILSPANQNMLAAVKPTVGRMSRYGVIPITADQDTPGPMARTVTDVAILLGVLESASPDPNDAATKTCAPPPGRDYTRFLRAGGLKGARIGIPRAFYYDRVTPPGAKEPRGGFNPEQTKVMTKRSASS